MKPKTDERRGLARESRKVRSALDELAALAKPKRRAPEVANAVPALMPTDSLSDLCFDDLLEHSEPISTPTPTRSATPAPAPPPAPYVPQTQSLSNLDDFFADIEMPANPSRDSMASDESTLESFNPGTNEDLFEGFFSEFDIPAKSEQDTLQFTARADGDPTPPEGYSILPVPEPPPATESINDLLDGFDW